MSNPLSTVLQTLANKTMTLGWDVLVCYSSQAVNDMFAQQFVANVQARQNLPPINQSLNVAGTQIQFINLTLGPPLISFSGNLTNQQATVTMNFIAGQVVLYGTSGPVQYVAGYQDIVPGDEYALQMIVDLQQVQGQVQHNIVVVDLKNAHTFSANLLPGSGSAAYLGQFFQSLFQNETQATLTYELGTIVTGSTQNLTPSSFDVRTQPNPQGGSDGAVLLLVATTYNPNGGNLPGATFPYLLPDGYSAALLVASKTLFSNIIGPAYTSKPGNPQVTVSQGAGSNPASYLNLAGGSINAGVVSGSWISGAMINAYWSGVRALSVSSGGKPVVFSFDGITIEPQSDHMSISWSSNFSQNFGIYQDQGRFWQMTSNSVTLTISANLSAQPKVGQDDDVKFTGAGTPDITFQGSSWLSKWFSDGKVRDRAAAAIASTAKAEIASIMNFPLPTVNTFAVSSLLFPANNALKYSDAYVPGDLALFGQVQPTETAFTLTPLQSVVGPGEHVQFTSSRGTGLTWSIFPRLGTISPAGLYTAPQRAPAGATPVVVTATDQANDKVTAIVVIVPAAVTISPAYVLVSPSSPPQTFTATALGGESVTWSIAPANGSLGTLSAAGVYTPPAPFPSGLTAAAVTASTSAGSVSAVVLLDNAVMAFRLAPDFMSLGAGETQQFTVSGTVTWSVLGPGSITPQGLYTAPSPITAPGTAIVVAEMQGNATLVGIAVVALYPRSAVSSALARLAQPYG